MAQADMTPSYYQSVNERFDEAWGESPRGTAKYDAREKAKMILLAELHAMHNLTIEEVEKLVEKLRPIDTEAKGWELLDKWPSCCPGDDAGGGYVAALDEVLTALAKLKV